MAELNLCVNIGKIKFPHPVLVASGTFGYGDEFRDLVEINKLAGIVTKTITLAPKEGNPPPRIAETSQGILNAIGLENAGLDNFINEKLPHLLATGIAVITSIGGENVREYTQLAKQLSKREGIAALELNISCPNIGSRRSRQPVTSSQLTIAQNAKATYKVVKSVRKVTKLPLITKLSPNVTDIVPIARAAQDAGSDAVSLVNTFLGMAININTKLPRLGNITGGLSGPAIKPIALRMVWEVANKIDIPLIGMGGIMSTEDALEFIIAGATLVAVGTANFINPKASLQIVEGIKKYMMQNRLGDIKELIGSLVLPSSSGIKGRDL